MAQVICKLPNASSLINGIKFVEHKIGEELHKISEEISDEVASVFERIPGYEVVKADTGASADAQAPAKRGPGRPPKTPQTPVEGDPKTSASDAVSGAAGTTSETADPQEQVF